jgi:hypothetical protein
VQVFFIVILLMLWSATTEASNAMLNNLKSFTAGGVGGKTKMREKQGVVPCCVLTLFVVRRSF